MIYCIWYPSGGFGHFINAILTLYGSEFVRPNNSLEFSADGNSHSLELVVPKYLYEVWPGGIEFDDSKNYSVLVDNGIDNETTKFKSVFPTADVIKICYSDYSWPIIARTIIEKAMRKDINEELPIDDWETDEDWCRREKYFLYLRGHIHRFMWKADPQAHSIDLGQLCDYDELFNALNQIIEIKDFKSTWQEWRIANDKYISPIETSAQIIEWVKNRTSQDLSHITDVWTQSILYYFIYLEYKFEVPHNDYAAWFTNTDDIAKMLDTYGVVY